MRNMLFPALALLLTVGAAQAAHGHCAIPVFPLHSTSDEGVRRVERQVNQWRQCQAARAAVQDPAVAAQQDIDLDAAIQKWASATRLHAHGRLSGRFSHAALGRAPREQLVTRLSPMPPVYGAERK